MTDTDMEYAIHVQGLNKHFGDKHVVKDVSINVKKGEIFGFLGPNGSGKTTCIRMLCGLLTPDSGSGTCLGYDILHETKKIKKKVGYMTQRFSFWDDLTIRENLDFVARVYEIPNRVEIVSQALHDLGLSERSGQLTGTLSGGWKQRVALAACLLHKPELLLLDEPTAGVDPSARRDFWDELHKLSSKGISVLVSTHYMDEAERCHKLAYIAWGDMLIQGSANEVIESVNLSTWEIFGTELNKISDYLKHQPGVDQVVTFGSSIHVSGADRDLLKHTIESLPKQNISDVQTIPSKLEHAFIYLMNHSRE